MSGNRDWTQFLCSPYVADYSVRSHDFLVNRPPVTNGEKLAFPHPNSVKRSALLVDRIYLPCWAPYTFTDMPYELTFGDPIVDEQTWEETWIYPEIDHPKGPVDEWHAFYLTHYLRNPLSRYRNAFPQASIVPINYEAGSAAIPLGNGHALQGVLNNVPVVLEQQLTWAQILEFRTDLEARRKYRNLHLWLTEAAHFQSEQHASDLIYQKLEDYRWAIRKHGLRTAVEAISSFVSLSAVVPPAAGLAANAVGLSTLEGALAGGALAAAGAAAWIAKRLLDLEDIKRGVNREVAYLYALQKLP